LLVVHVVEVESKHVNMFSFLRPSCVLTGTPGYAYIFNAMSDESYILAGSLAVGLAEQGAAGGQHPHPRGGCLKGKQAETAPERPSPSANVPEDREVRILDHLNSLIHNLVHPSPGFTPL